MGTQHTPGPWTRDRSDDIHDANGDIVCGASGPTAEEQEANAALISAAPELLIQLKGLIGLAEFFISAVDVDTELTKVVLRNKGEAVAEVPIAVLLEHSKAAISKAEGRS